VASNCIARASTLIGKPRGRASPTATPARAGNWVRRPSRAARDDKMRGSPSCRTGPLSSGVASTLEGELVLRSTPGRGSTELVETEGGLGDAAAAPDRDMRARPIGSGRGCSCPRPIAATMSRGYQSATDGAMTARFRHPSPSRRPYRRERWTSASMSRAAAARLRDHARMVVVWPRGSRPSSRSALPGGRAPGVRALAAARVVGVQRASRPPAVGPRARRNSRRRGPSAGRRARKRWKFPERSGCLTGPAASHVLRSGMRCGPRRRTTSSCETARPSPRPRTRLPGRCRDPPRNLPTRRSFRQPMGSRSEPSSSCPLVGTWRAPSRRRHRARSTHAALGQE
jgi:hypothetical protein